uniref:Uncharacterized protein n=1 Tax=Rhipicephalus zambeziensis TaxID=60191 RepID=A0A224YGU0_9ACAR
MHCSRLLNRLLADDKNALLFLSSVLLALPFPSNLGNLGDCHRSQGQSKQKERFLMQMHTHSRFGQTCIQVVCADTRAKCLFDNRLCEMVNLGVNLLTAAGKSHCVGKLPC